MANPLGDNYRTVNAVDKGSFSTTLRVNYAWTVPRLCADGMTGVNPGGKLGAIVFFNKGRVANAAPATAATARAQAPVYGAKSKYAATVATTAEAAAWGEAGDSWGHLDDGAKASRIAGGPDMPTVADVAIEWLAGGAVSGGGSVARHYLSGVAFRSRNMQPLPTPLPYEITPRPSTTSSGYHSIYDAGMPCSAYLMRCVISGNANAIAYGTVEQWQFPAVGIGADS